MEKISFPHFRLFSEIYEAHSIEEAMQKINEEGFVMFCIHKDAEANGKHLFCLGKIDMNRAVIS